MQRTSIKTTVLLANFLFITGIYSQPANNSAAPENKAGGSEKVISHGPLNKSKPDGLLDGITSSLWAPLTGIGPLIFITSGASTWFIVDSGVDDSMRSRVVKSPALPYSTTRFGFHLGHFWQPGLGLGLFSIGHIYDFPVMRKSGVVVLQALAVSLLYVNTLKLTTGRMAPHRTSDSGNFKAFAFDLNLKKPRTFWPSGHTATSFAVLGSLIGYGKLPWYWQLPLLGLSMYMGVAMMEGNYHWFSDISSGALIGFWTGYSVGRSLSRQHSQNFNFYQDQNRMNLSYQWNF